MHRFDLQCGGEVWVFAKLAEILADDDALRQKHGCKNCSGLKVCFICVNVFDRRDVPGILGRSADAVSHNCSD